MGGLEFGDDMARKTETIAAIRDVADFHLRWREFRVAAVRVAGHPALDPEERGVVGWLIALADRVGEGDVRPDAERDGGA